MQIRQGVFRWPLLKLSLGLLLIGWISLGSQAATQNEIEERMRQDLKFLASKECEGRGVETKGLEKAADYIANQFKKFNLKPGGADGTYFQPFKVNGPAKLEQGSSLVLQGPQGQTIELKEKQHFSVMGLSAPGKANAPLVFVGYGATAPRIKYDDYKGVDVEGKIVIVVRRAPRWNSKELPFDGDMKENHASLQNKTGNAELHKAAAVLLVNDASEVRGGDKFTNFTDLSRGYSTGSVPVMQIKRQVVDQILLSSLGQGLSEIEKAIDRDLQPRSAELKGWKVKLDAKVSRKTIAVKNVIGIVEGSGLLAKEIVVIGAHYDHLGYGEVGSRAKGADEKKKIHFGADDNASGTTSVLELARRFGGMKKHQGRTLVFMTFSAEEKGLLGSRYFCNKEPLFPLDKIAAMVNLDMVGRMQTDEKTGKGKLLVQGTGTSKEFDNLIEKFNKKYDFQLNKVKQGTGPSDHDSFYRKKIPVFFIWTGIHKDYHLPTDTWDKINYSDMRRIVDLSEEIITHLATDNNRPEYVYIPSQSPGPVMGAMPKLGIAPNYDPNRKGLLIEEVSPGGAAATAGLKAGDLIIAIADQPVTNINTYMLIMRQQKPGQPVSVTVERDGKKLTVKATPK